MQVLEKKKLAAPASRVHFISQTHSQSASGDLG